MVETGLGALPKLLSLKATVKDLLGPTEFPKESKIVPEVICEVDEPSAGKVFGVAVKSLCRSQDVAARYGGEEFLLILPETDGKGAWIIAERVREEVESHRFDYEGKSHSVTISCGIAELDNEKNQDFAGLIGVADQALYQAKESGRNRTLLGGGDEIL